MRRKLHYPGYERKNTLILSTNGRQFVTTIRYGTFTPKLNVKNNNLFRGKLSVLCGTIANGDGVVKIKKFKMNGFLFVFVMACYTNKHIHTNTHTHCKRLTLQFRNCCYSSTPHLPSISLRSEIANAVNKPDYYTRFSLKYSCVRIHILGIVSFASSTR